MHLDDCRRVFEHVASSLRCVDSPFDASGMVLSPRVTSLLQRKKSGPSGLFVLVLDEVDALAGLRVGSSLAESAKQLIQQIFSLPYLPASRVLLLTISNRGDFHERYIPSFKAKGWSPKQIVFGAYGEDDITEVLSKRLAATNAIHTNAIRLCAKKVGAASGDMRRVLDICRDAISLAIREIEEAEEDEYDLTTREAPNDDANLDRAARMTQEKPLVDMRHMSLSLAKSFKSPIRDAIVSLPQTHQMILCAATTLRNKIKQDFSLGEVYCAGCLHAMHSATLPSLSLRAVMTGSWRPNT